MTCSTAMIVTAARDILKAYGYFVDNLWHANDVHFLCRQHNYLPLSHDEAMEVFDIANEQFDGEHGINWPQLEHALHCFVQSRNALEQVVVEEKA